MEVSDQAVKDHPLSNVIKRPDILETDDKMMELAVSDAGTWCYGVKAIDVWIYNKNRGRLVAARGGRWVDPVYFQNSDPAMKIALMKIYDPTFPDYLDPIHLSVAPGEGLAGALWTETSGKSFTPAVEAPLTIENINKRRVRRKIQWRDVQGMADDPDQPYNKRMQVIAEAGFRLAAGVPFNIRGKTRGIVVFMGRISVDMDKMSSLLNEEYMLTAAEHIGSVLALRYPRQLARQERTFEKRGAFQKAIQNIIIASRIDSVSAESEVRTEENVNANANIETHSTKNQKISEFIENAIVGVKSYSYSWAQKMRGGNVIPPPGLKTSEVLFAMIAVFFTVIIMSIINVQVKNAFGANLGFELGQIGGLSTLVFTLSAAPGAQPRSIIMAQLGCMIIGMIFANIPATGDPFDSPLEWLRVACSVATSCAFMASLGIVHPPGGGLAVIFLQFGWERLNLGFQKLGVLMLQDVLFISIASIIVNLNTNPAKRYPTYWGHTINMISRFLAKFLPFKEKEPKNA